MPSRKHRRADGSLRPAYRRYRARKRKAQIEAMTPEQRAEHDTRMAARRAWLDQFEPGVRTRFFREIVLADAIWLRAFSETLGLPQEEAAPLLEQLAEERRWRKLRTRDGMVVGIGPDRRAKRAAAQDAVAA